MKAQAKIGILGLGMIGASLALALKEHRRIVGYDVDTAVVDSLLSRSVIDERCDNLKDFSSCAAVFVCVPVAKVAEVIDTLYAAVKDSTIITDVASLKMPMKNSRGRYVGGHPMAGVERSGADSANAHLFENAYYIVVPSQSKKDTDCVVELVKLIKAKPILMTAEEHDKSVAAVSHMPHAAMYSLVNAVLPDLNKDAVVGTGFLDSTRIAKSDEVFWTNVMRLNKQNVLDSLDGYIDELAVFRAALADEEWATIEKKFRSARKARERAELDLIQKEDYVIELDIADKVGALSGILKVLSDADVSVANLSVASSREESAALRIAVRKKDGYERAIKALKKEGLI